MFIDRNLSYRIGNNPSANRILNLCDGSTDSGINTCAVLESTIASRVEGAILKRESIYIAERLFAQDMTANETQVLGMPAEVFAIKVRIIYGYVLCFPEGILCDNMRIANNDILDILENILRVALKAIDINILAKHERISAFVQTDVAHLQILDAPESLISVIQLNILDCQAIHFAEELGRIDDGVAHDHVVAIPYSGT